MLAEQPHSGTGGEKRARRRDQGGKGKPQEYRIIDGQEETLRTAERSLTMMPGKLLLGGKWKASGDGWYEGTRSAKARRCSGSGAVKRRKE